MLMSLHRCDDFTFYPFRKDCKGHYVGEGDGAGFNVNVAWETGTLVDEENRSNNKVVPIGNHDYKHACETLLFPIAR